jgi:DNA-directed RNA polymerase II subunit RPB1
MKHSGNLLKRSTCEAAEVRFVRFCTLSKAELESWSVAEITESRIYEGTHPVRGGPNDLRLGVNSLEFPCDTCGETRDCQGHFGHIKLV